MHLLITEQFVHFVKEITFSTGGTKRSAHLCCVGTWKLNCSTVLLGTLLFISPVLSLPDVFTLSVCAALRMSCAEDCQRVPLIGLPPSYKIESDIKEYMAISSKNLASYLNGSKPLFVTIFTNVHQKLS